MNAKFDAPCRFYVQGNCREGDQCKYSHDTSNIERVNLVRDEKGKLNLKKNNDYQTQDRKIVRGRGRGRGQIDRYQEEEQTKDNYKIDKSDRIEQKQRQQQPRNSYEQKSGQRFGQQKEGNENRQIKQKWDRNQDQQENQIQKPVYREKNNQERNNVNSERWQRNQDIENGDDQQQFQQNTRGRGRGRGRGGRENTFTKRDQIQDEENENERPKERMKERTKERPSQSEQQIENVSITKKVKKNEIQVKKRHQVLNLAQKKNISNLIQIAGYHFQFLGILRTDAIDFYQIPFKRNGIEIIDEERKVTISQTDKQFISAFMQEHPNNEYTLIIQFQKEEESFKNLLVFHNVFHQQCPQIISDISMKEIVYTNFEDGQLFTFCKDGLIRIFTQNDIGQLKYTQHYNVEQSMESVIKVGSNFLIGMRSGQLYLFNGKILTEIPYKFTQKCTQMIIDFNRVILKMDDDIQTSIYILSQNLEIIGPIYKGEKVICLELIKSYESDKLFILGFSESVEIHTEIENKLYPINVMLHQRLMQMKKIEITNENMVTQKFIVGECDEENENIQCST
ncbi:unnamed protein product (macronuclear) [Paramecium tetraurelia]|uniref:C3H1-type domain-containing protein n=1 Tax=Paramecium tetraurelia TaxID=5888 RepID=A0C1Q3_PARTE|nr:uncharacterized protein GSPATT00034197001 [Paramecium tetraurelia]CAK64720.1 unnamed protein product [Paramecium tetraurelia]|eukprot:XP_001432117.1 hypothetical protein (macronuclear) [Paramecium tetraurelia strain d4-2]